MNTTTTAETATAAATTPLDPDPDTIKMFVGQVGLLYGLNAK